MTPPFLIAIVGGSASGKTTLARALSVALGVGASLVCEDDYYRCSSTVPGFDPLTFNFDDPRAKDHALLAEQLAGLRRGEDQQRPDYCLTTHTRRAAPLALPAHPVILAEGLHLLVDPAVRAQFDLRVFVDCPADVRLARRMARDVAERGRDVMSVLGQYLANVRPMHKAHVSPQAALAHITVDGESGLDDAVPAILSYLPEALRP